MKKIAVVLAVMIMVVSFVSLVFAAEVKKGTIKSVDAEAGTIVLTVGDSDMTLKADKSVDLSKLKAGKKVQASIENDVVMSVKPVRAAVGC